MPDPTHTPYSPESVCGDFGWLWLDGPMGHEWVLVHTFGEEDGVFVDLIGRMEADGSRDSPSGYRYAGTPYLPCIAPTARPGECDGLEITIRFDNGASVTHAFAAGARAAQVQEAVTAAVMQATADAPPPPPAASAPSVPLVNRSGGVSPPAPPPGDRPMPPKK